MHTHVEVCNSHAVTDRCNSDVDDVRLFLLGDKSRHLDPEPCGCLNRLFKDRSKHHMGVRQNPPQPLRQKG